MYFLDTNSCIYLLKNAYPALTAKVLATEHQTIKIASIVYAELLGGARESSAPEKSLVAVKKFVSQFEIVPFGEDAAESYGRIRSGLLEKRLKCGANDMIIAATAMARGGVVVTNNEKGFGKMHGVATENWAKP